MRARVSSLTGRFLPNGVLDVFVQVALMEATYMAYRLVRGWIDDPTGAAVAFQNGRSVIHIEQSLGIFVEPKVQELLGPTGLVGDAASWMYLNAQVTVTLGALVYLYLRHNRSFYFVRNMFIVAWFIALLGYMVFPTAPPRFFPEWGFVDSVADFTGIDPLSTTGANALFNPYAAVPSMHVAFALMIGMPARGARQAPRGALVLDRVPADRDVRDRHDRQPLRLRRDPRRADRRLRLRRRVPARSRPPGVGLPRRAGARHRLMTDARVPGERREAVRSALIESRLTPNAISITGLVLVVIGAGLIWAGSLVLGGAAFAIGSICDTLDGRYSRMSGKGTQFGAFLDSTLDRVGEGLALFAACYLFADQGQPVNAALCAFAILASVMVSYTRARAEALDADASVGFGSRATRVVILSAGLILGGILGYDDPVSALSISVWVLAAISTITTVQRIAHVRKALLQPASAGGTPSDDL